MKKAILVILLLLCVIAIVAWITASITYVDPDKAMINSFIGCFGWHSANDIQLFQPEPLRSSLYGILKDNIAPNNIEGLQLNLKEDDIGIRAFQQCIFDLKEKGLYSPLECQVFLEDHKIVAIVIKTKDTQYARDRGYYPIYYSHNKILQDLQRQQSMGPPQEQTN